MNLDGVVASSIAHINRIRMVWPLFAVYASSDELNGWFGTGDAAEAQRQLGKLIFLAHESTDSRASLQRMLRILQERSQSKRS